jgi:hypothetical protein
MRKSTRDRLVDLETNRDSLQRCNDEMSKRIIQLECAMRGHGRLRVCTEAKIYVQPDALYYGTPTGPKGGPGTLTTTTCTECGTQISKTFALDSPGPKREAVTVVPDHYLAAVGDVPGEVSHLADYNGDPVGELIQPGQIVIVLSEEQGLKVLDDLSYVSDELELVTKETVELKVKG